MAWVKTALIIEKFVGKGKEIAVEGKLKVRNYETKEGEKRTYTEVVAHEVLLFGSNQGNISTY